MLFALCCTDDSGCTDAWLTSLHPWPARPPASPLRWRACPRRPWGASHPPGGMVVGRGDSRPGFRDLCCCHPTAASNAAFKAALPCAHLLVNDRSHPRLPSHPPHPEHHEGAGADGRCQLGHALAQPHVAAAGGGGEACKQRIGGTSPAPQRADAAAHHAVEVAAMCASVRAHPSSLALTFMATLALHT